MAIDKTKLTGVEKVYPLRVSPYEQYMGDFQNPSVVSKLNAMLQSLHQMGRLTNETVSQWNNVMKWIVEGGMDEIATNITTEKVEVALTEVMRMLDVSLNSGLKDLATDVTDKKISELLERGQFESMISESLVEINEVVEGKLEGFNLQLAETVKKEEGGIITPVMLSQATKEQMTGGSVAVVGDNAVLTNNIVNGAVSESKLSKEFKEDTVLLNGEDRLYIPLNDGSFTAQNVNNNKICIQGIPIPRKGRLVVNINHPLGGKVNVFILEKLSDTQFKMKSNAIINVGVGKNSIVTDIQVNGLGSEYLGVLSDGNMYYKAETGTVKPYLYYESSLAITDFTSNVDHAFVKKPITHTALLAFYPGVQSNSVKFFMEKVKTDLGIGVEPKGVINVAKSGGDYSTIMEAVNNAGDSAVNPVTIVIHPGVYKERVKIRPGRFLSLVGIDKSTCIIRDDSGVYGEEPLRFECSGYVANLTIISTHAENVADPKTLFAYAVHSDDKGGAGGSFEMFNCIMISHTSAAMGIGLQQNQTIKLTNCELYSKTVAGSPYLIYGALVCHSSNRAIDVTGQKLIVKHSLLHSERSKALAIQDLGDGDNREMSVEFIQNTVYSKELGKNNIITKDSLTTGNFSKAINLSPASHGNNLPEMNA